MSPRRLAGCHLLLHLPTEGAAKRRLTNKGGTTPVGFSRLFCRESVLLNKVGEKEFSLNRKFSLALQGMRSCDRLKKE